MEKLPRLTRSKSHKLLFEKSLPNRLQRLSNGGYKRKADFLTLSERRKRTHRNGTEPFTNRCPSSPAESTKKLSDENTHLENGTPDSPSLFSDLEIVVALPLTPPSCSSPDTSKTVSEISHSETPDSANLKMRSLSESPARENSGVCSKSTPSEFKAFHLDLTLDTDSEDQIPWPQWDLSRSSLSDAEGIAIKSEEDHMGFSLVKPLGVSDTCNILAKWSDPGNTDVQADLAVCKGNIPLLSRVKEEPPDSDTPTKGCFSEPRSGQDSEKETGCWKVKQAKSVCRLGPGSRRLFSVSRLADFLRSNVEVIDIDDDDHTAKIDSKVRAQPKTDASRGGCNAGPVNKQLTKFPGQRKVTLSPSSQLKLLEASNISSYRRMLPFCTEMAKDLARTSVAQSTPKTLSTIVSVASKECDTHTGEVSDRECSSLEHVKTEQTERQSDLVSSDGCPNKEPIPVEHIKLENYECQMELFSHDKYPSRELFSTEHVKLEENESQPDLAPADGLRSKPFSIEHVKLEQPESQLELIPSDGGQGWGSLLIEHVKPEQNESQPVSASNDQGLSGDSLLIEHVQSEQHGYQSEPSSASLLHDPSNELEKNVVAQSSTNSTPLSSFNVHCPSPLTVQNPSTTVAHNVFPVEHKSPPPSLSGSVDFSCAPTCETPSQLGTPASVPSKGILRISPRSCKGTCICSDCTSFRLQAEKASDFAERQLREVEALAVPLMNELASMRMLMERSLIMKPRGAGLPYAIHSEVKGASRSALKVEETARNHLMQITRDTNRHCKIMRMQQRRVKFADKIEVKLFQSE